MKYTTLDVAQTLRGHLTSVEADHFSTAQAIEEWQNTLDALPKAKKTEDESVTQQRDNAQMNIDRMTDHMKELEAKHKRLVAKIKEETKDAT